MKRSFYCLQTIQELAKKGSPYVQLTKRAQTEAFNEFGFSLREITDIILELKETDFYKSDTSKLNGLPLDAYKKMIRSNITNKHHLTYLKFQIVENLIVVSFHTSDF